MPKVKIKSEECIGCALCSSISPEVFSFDEKTLKGKVKKVSVKKEEVKESITSCPSNAISMTKD